MQIAVMLGGLYFLYRVFGHGRRVQESGAPGFVPVTPGDATGSWNAVVTSEGKHPNFSGQRGHLRIENGWLGFHEENAEQPTWVVPANQLRGGRNTFLAMSEVWLESAETGRVNLTVSHEHINTFVDNDFKDMRERRYAGEFLSMLAHYGAQVSF
ncbi:hypothetical protein ACOCJ7_07935 [Knoellia sp. CPCC 206453]|uniref:hypothetical protein n=1 Tax=Knoellia pratensis TaxID=3404796 RepID=UPI00360D8167